MPHPELHRILGLFLSVTAALTLPASAAEQTWHVVDGDTVVFAGERIRVANIDTPEITHAQCDAERRLGRVAKAEMEKLLGSGKISLTIGDPFSGRKKDKYGRTLGVLSVDGRDVGDILMSREMARPWTGKRHSWCD